MLIPRRWILRRNAFGGGEKCGGSEVLECAMQVNSPQSQEYTTTLQGKKRGPPNCPTKVQYFLLHADGRWVYEMKRRAIREVRDTSDDGRLFRNACVKEGKRRERFGRARKSPGWGRSRITENGFESISTQQVDLATAMTSGLWVSSLASSQPLRTQADSRSPGVLWFVLGGGRGRWWWWWWWAMSVLGVVIGRRVGCWGWLYRKQAVKYVECEMRREGRYSAFRYTRYS